AALRRRRPQGEVRGDALPAPLPEGIDVRVVPHALLAVRLRIAESRIDDTDVAHDSNAGVDRRHVRAGTRPADTVQDSCTGGPRPVGIAGHEAGRQVLVEPADVRRLGGLDVTAVELLERLDVVGVRAPRIDR